MLSIKIGLQPVLISLHSEKRVKLGNKQLFLTNFSIWIDNNFIINFLHISHAKGLVIIYQKLFSLNYS